MNMKTETRTNINVADEISFVPVSEQVKEEHASQILSVISWKGMTKKEKKKEASKPIYLVRYE
jgi:hypothetical protein